MSPRRLSALSFSGTYCEARNPPAHTTRTHYPPKAVWTGREPVSFFIKALDLEWRYTTAFGGLDRYGTPVVLGYVAMPLSSPEP